jgi:hypothetical protein
MSSFDEELDARIAILIGEAEASEGAPPPAPTTPAEAEAAAREMDGYIGSEGLQFVAVIPGDGDGPDAGDGPGACRIAVWWDEFSDPLGFVYLEGAKRWFEPNEDSNAAFVFGEVEARDMAEFLPLLREELLSSLAEMLTTDFSEVDELD